MKSLDLVATVPAQGFELLRRLHPLGDDAHLEAVAEPDHRLGDRPVVAVVGDITHEGLVDLEPIDREALEVGKARIAGAEIVDGDLDAHRRQPFQGLDGASRNPIPNHYDPTLVEAVKRFQARHGLEPDGVIGAQTLLAFNTSPARRAEQIRANLERLRWVAADLRGDRLLVDIVGYHADLVLDGQPVWESKVIVGKPARKTPSLRDSVVNLVFNPKWVVPPTILREDVIPRAARNPGYLASQRLRVVDRSGQSVDPSTIDWGSARQSGFPYRVVQQSGADGSLGRIKFALSNPYAIYLHDTNARSLFGRAERALSSGCVRVAKPAELARILLDDPVSWSAEALEAALASGRTRTVGVGRDVTVLLHYSTAGLDEHGRLQLRNDIYDYDRAILDTLAARRTALPR